MRLFLHYQDSRNPLGIGESVWMAGFQLEESAYAPHIRGGTPGIDGSIALGPADRGRVSGRWMMRFLSPSFADAQRIVIALEANVLTADGVGELYYLYHLGWERVRGRLIHGAYFHHRSNHLVAEPNDTLTDINVVEAGVSTDGWEGGAGRRRGSGWRAVEARARLGYLADSSFDEDRRWHFVGGVRWSPPWAARRLAPFVQAELEAGDVGRESLALGIVPLRDVALQIEYRRDEQHLATDRNTLLFLARYGF